MKPWSAIPILENDEDLVTISSDFNFVEPHPYLKLGAPYQCKNKLWNLRKGVLKRLKLANNYLKSKYSDYSLLLYDTWRPIEVQRYMFNFAFESECKKKGLKIPIDLMDHYPEIVSLVEKFWAYPSSDIKCPPPHSTGAALDLSMIDLSGNLVDMGCEIDMIDKSAHPDFYKRSKSPEAVIWDKRRNILKEIMLKFDFAQHPNEWWHFSYGDQLWAWKKEKDYAIYGKI